MLLNFYTITENIWKYWHYKMFKIIMKIYIYVIMSNMYII